MSAPRPPARPLRTQARGNAPRLFLAAIVIGSLPLPHAFAATAPKAPSPAATTDRCQGLTEATWARGIEGQRMADLANGCYLNPILAGDHPDPSILKDGTDYYMTFSTFDAYPGLVIWHSRDLVNWQPLVAALRRNVGSVWAPELVKHGGRYYIYFPGLAPTYRSNYVVWADKITGPWSDPIDLGVRNGIDPGHAVGEDGRRYLFFSAGRYARLSDDGTALASQPVKVYDGWRYPNDWIVETFAQEGPKILKHGEYYHMLLAEGGTAGPPTGHMIVSARSKSIHGPWENSPYNPIARTLSADERWWSKGHGTLVEGPKGDWFIVYHAYEKGFHTLGRQTILEPVTWTEDGWIKLAGDDPARPVRWPGADTHGKHGFALSDDFSTSKMGIQWSFYNGDADDNERYRFEDGSLILQAEGTSPSTSSPLWFVAGDLAYEIEVEIEIDERAAAGLLVFYNQRLYAGLGFSNDDLIMHRYGLENPSRKPAEIGRRLSIRLINDRNLLSLYYSADGKEWQRFDRRMDVSGCHHNTVGDFLSLRPALYVTGQGEARFRNFKYRALP
jgi:xylan 1,4-beta-xylosidase